jgi:sec-independent protein translocase protein TatA
VHHLYEFAHFSPTFGATKSFPMNSVLLISFPGGSEWVLIFLAILLLFGGKKIPELMRGIGAGIREFNRAKADVHEQIEQGMKEDPKKETPNK